MDKQHTLITGILGLAMLLALTSSAILAIQKTAQPNKIRRVKRVRRPQFDTDSSPPLYFKDLYAEGTVGPRPTVTENSASETLVAESSGTADFDPWSKIIDAAVIEDEVKSIQQQLNTLVTSPVVFQTKFNDVNERFEILSILFAIVRQYEGDIRWKEHAVAAQLLFEQAAVASRSGSLKGFQFCKSRREDLEILVRGGSIAINSQAREKVDWETAADRSPIMVRLEIANEELKKLTSNESAFQANSDRIFHHSNLIAAMAKVIIQPGMPEAEEDSYVAFSRSMKSAAAKLKSAVKTNDFKIATAAANLVSKSCADCHAEWR